jgi:aminopeptidase N
MWTLSEVHRPGLDMESYAVTPDQRRNFLLVLAAWASVASLHAGPPHYAADRPLEMQHIRLDLTVDLVEKRVAATATLRMTPLRPVTSVKLDAVDFETRRVACLGDDGTATELSYTDDGHTIEAVLGQTAGPGEPVTLTIEYAVHDPRAGLHFISPTPDDPNAPTQLWSLGEPSDARYWIPCFDNPNERQTSELVVTAADGWQVLSNGRLVSSAAAPLPGHTVYHWVQDRPLASYLITLVVGHFQVVAQSWHDIPVAYWVPADRAADAEPTFGRTPEMLDFFSARIGMKYPWAKYVQVCCHGYPGGMENTSATTFGDDLLIREPAPLDPDVDMMVSHELAHQWWGDLLTCREWAHLWLNEGFASYFEALWTEHRRGPDEFAYEMYQAEEPALAGGRDRPIVDREYNDAGELFDSRAYQKGAWVLHMLRRQLGDDAFWQVIHQYCADFADHAVETVDLRQTAESVTGRSLEQFFHDWTERPGAPVLDVRFDWSEEQKTATVVIKQVQKTAGPAPQSTTPAEPFHFPLRLEFTVAGQAEPVAITRGIDRVETEIVVPLPERPTMLRVDPDNSVLKEITEHKGRDLWLAQLTADPDPIGRIRAAQALAAIEPGPANLPTPIGEPRETVAADDFGAVALAGALRSERFWAVRSTLARLLGERTGEVARDALIAALTDEYPDVRRTSLEGLGNFRGDPEAVAAVGSRLAASEPSDSVYAAAIASYARLAPDDLLRALQPVLARESRDEVVRNAALEALGNQGGEAAVELLGEWAGEDKPSTCRQTALTALARAAERSVVPDEFAAAVAEQVAASLHASDPEVREAGARALGALGPAAQRQVSALGEIAEKDAVAGVRQAAQEALTRIQRPRPPDAGP